MNADPSDPPPTGSDAAPAVGPQALGSLLERLASPPRSSRLMAGCIQRYRALSPDVVKEGVQDAFEKTLRHYAHRVPPIATVEEAERVLLTVIRNTMIDLMRRAKTLRFVTFDEQVPVPKSLAAEAAGAAGAPPPDDPDTLADRLMAEEVDAGRRVDTSDLFDAVMEQFDPKYAAVIVRLVIGDSPQELAEAFGQDGYRMRHWARVKFCRALAQLAAKGHDLAAEWHARVGCAALLKSAGVADS